MGRKRLKSRLNFLWKNGDFDISDFVKCKRNVYCIACDDSYVYCGTVDGFIEVYHAFSGDLKYQLCCKADSSAGAESVQFDVGDDDLATLTESGTISIWNKQSGKLNYQAKHHGENISVFGIKVFAENVVTGAGDGSVVLLEKTRDEEWVIKSKVYTNKEEITHIDIDQGWLVTGTRAFIKLWNLGDLEQGPRPDPIEVHPWMLILHFPFMFVVGGELWGGLQVWNVETRRRMRNIEIDNKQFHTLSSNGDLLVISEIVELWPGDDPQEVSILVFDKKELCDDGIADDKLWRRERICEQTFAGGEVNAAINKSILVVAHSDLVDIQHFWVTTGGDSGIMPT